MVIDRRVNNKRRGSNLRVKLRKLSSGDEYGVTIPKEIALQYRETKFLIIPNGNDIILKSASKEFAEKYRKKKELKQLSPFKIKLMKLIDEGKSCVEIAEILHRDKGSIFENIERLLSGKYLNKIKEIHKLKIRENGKRLGNLEKTQYWKDKSKKTRIKNGWWLPDSEKDAFVLYRQQVTNETNKHKKKLYKKWDGYCFYTGKFIFDNKNSCDKPSIDHKESVFWGFTNNTSPKYISRYDNLCICSHSVNSSKGKKCHYF